MFELASEHVITQLHSWFFGYFKGWFSDCITRVSPASIVWVPHAIGPGVVVGATVVVVVGALVVVVVGATVVVVVAPIQVAVQLKPAFLVLS